MPGRTLYTEKESPSVGLAIYANLPAKGLTLLHPLRVEISFLGEFLPRYIDFHLIDSYFSFRFFLEIRYTEHVVSLGFRIVRNS